MLDGADVTRRQRRARTAHADRAGDPLDGLVNMFDLGIVLAVAFLLAALQSVNLTELLTEQGRHDRAQDGDGGQTVVDQGGRQAAHASSSPASAAGGAGERVGSVYRLPDGRLVYVRRAK